MRLPRRHLIVALAVALASAGAACGRTDAAASRTRPVTLLTGPSGGAYYPLGKALADLYNSNIDAVVTAKGADGPGGAGGNAEAIDAGEADLAFSRSDLAYQAFRGPADHAGTESHVRAMAVLYTNAVHVLVRRTSGITQWADVRGKRVQVGDESGGGTLARMVLEGHGLKLSDVQIVPNPRNAVARLRSGELDVRIFASAYPLAALDVSEDSGVRMMAVEADAVDRLRSSFPFFKPAIIPKGTYPGQDDDVRTVGIDGLLLCRDSLPESLVYEMTKRLFAALPELARAQPVARLINEGRAPTTPVPLHPGAARYYRERDLFR